MERTPPSACELLISLRLLIPLRVWQPTIHPRHGFIDPDVLFFSQAGQSSTVIENIHTIIAAAAVKFSFDQLTHLFILIQKVSAQGRVPGNRISLTDKCCTNLLLLFFSYLELGGWKWPREAEAAQSDREDRQGGPFRDHDWKGSSPCCSDSRRKAKRSDEQICSGFGCGDVSVFPRCWRCCGSWPTSPPCPLAWFSRPWRSTWGSWATLMPSRRRWSAITSSSALRTLRRWVGQTPPPRRIGPERRHCCCFSRGGNVSYFPSFDSFVS